MDHLERLPDLERCDREDPFIVQLWDRAAIHSHASEDFAHTMILAQSARSGIVVGDIDEYRLPRRTPAKRAKEPVRHRRMPRRERPDLIPNLAGTHHTISNQLSVCDDTQ